MPRSELARLRARLEFAVARARRRGAPTLAVCTVERAPGARSGSRRVQLAARARAVVRARAARPWPRGAGGAGRGCASRGRGRGALQERRRGLARARRRRRLRPARRPESGSPARARRLLVRRPRSGQPDMGGLRAGLADRPRDHPGTRHRRRRAQPAPRRCARAADPVRAGLPRRQSRASSPSICWGASGSCAAIPCRCSTPPRPGGSAWRGRCPRSTTRRRSRAPSS